MKHLANICLIGVLGGCNVVLNLPEAVDASGGTVGESNGGSPNETGGTKNKGGTSAKGGTSSKTSSTTKVIPIVTGGTSSTETPPAGGAVSYGGSVSSSGGTTASTGGTSQIGGSAASGGTTSTGGSTVVASPAITSFTVDYNKVCSGNPATLTAVFSNGTGTVSGGVGTITSGIAKATGAITANTTYTLTVTNSKGEKVESSIAVTALKSGDFTPTGAPATAVYNGELLPNGNVLYMTLNCSIYQYDFPSGTFSLVGTNSPCRVADSITSLGNGTVLLAPWDVVNSLPQAKIFDPSNGQFSTSAMMSSYHGGAKSVYLPATGRVLEIGGEDGQALASYDTVEIFDPNQGENGAFTTIKMQIPRANHTATLLTNGKVLVTGGAEYNNGDSFHSSAEIFDPVLNAFSLTGSMSKARSYHAAALLPNGDVLIVGGSNGADSTSDSSAEIFSPSTGKFTLISAKLSLPRSYNHSLVTLKTGRVLVFGGIADAGTWQHISEIYNASTEKFTVLPNTSKTRGIPVMLANGAVLIAGTDENKVPFAELFCP
jgi:hypothetical protein